MYKASTRYLIFSFFAFLLISNYSFCQQGNIWYFGEYAGLNFNTNPPTPLTDGQLNTYEGCASICDKNGQLLFYTDGRKVYNRNHQVMPNGDGLMGGPSSTHSAIIVPKPGSSAIYYIFTAEPINSTLVTSYHFSEVDMQLDGGLGDVTGQKNILLYTRSTERLAAVKQANGVDYWVVTKGFGNDSFSVYKVSCDGVNMTPVVSNIGAVPTGLYDAIGAIKLSPDGKKLCIAINGYPGSPKSQLFDFDNATGIISNCIDLSGYALNGLYGVEFSSNSKLLYLSGNSNKVYQYDITSNNQVTINASKYTIIAIGEENEALQLGPDKKIYVASYNKTSINVINNPDISGPGCNFTIGGVNLNGRKSLLGLPTYISSFFDTSSHINFIHTLVNCQVQFTGTTNLTGNLQWSWNFGDGATATGQTVNHTYIQLGTYTATLKVIPVGNCITGDSFFVSHPVVIEKDTVSRVDFTHAFNNCQVQFSGSTNFTGNMQWYWDFGDGTTGTGQIVNHTYNRLGTYTVTLKGEPTENCIMYDTFFVSHVLTLNDTSSYVDFAHVFANCQVQFSGTTNSTNNLQWNWNFGDGVNGTGQIINHTYNQWGIYTITLKGIPITNCIINDTFFASHPVPINLNVVTVSAGRDTLAFLNLPIQLNATGTPANVTYMWSPVTGLNNPFISNPVALLRSDVTYMVTVTDNNGCTATDDIFIKVFSNPEVYVPNSFTPNADGKNDNLKPLGFGLKKIVYFKIYNRYGELIFETNTLGIGWDGTFKGKVQPAGAYTYMVKVINFRDWPVEQTGTVIIIR
ncbi:MAG: PKD domain-containing protein [Ferruginibacter sp.]